MPCRNDYAEPTHEELRRDWEAQLRHDSELAEMLCYVLCELDKADVGWRLPANIYKWWEEHKKRDLVKNALAKLTDKEKKALGLSE